MEPGTIPFSEECHWRGEQGPICMKSKFFMGENSPYTSASFTHPSVTTSYISPKLPATPRHAGSVLGSAPHALIEQGDLPLLPGCLPLPSQSTTNQNCLSLCPKTFFPICNSSHIPAPRCLRVSGEPSNSKCEGQARKPWKKEHPDGFIAILRSALTPLRVLNQDP